MLQNYHKGRAAIRHYANFHEPSFQALLGDPDCNDGRNVRQCRQCEEGGCQYSEWKATGPCNRPRNQGGCGQGQQHWTRQIVRGNNAVCSRIELSIALREVSQCLAKAQSRVFRFLLAEKFKILIKASVSCDVCGEESQFYVYLP